MKWIYPKVINELKNGCTSFLSGNINIKEIQSIIYNAEHQIASLEENWFRELLFLAENEIELIQYTFNNEEITANVIPIIESILNKIENYS
ncbi:hypothetical protein [Stenoxybacter acetivorans]|uniref:hypothetical protein n=1 Tax=Stenoxybacter acetivorans TaxID=422441 RepID=UPI00056A5FEC|nr:hypothetical protein [Stenoxybacter acetivorans]